MNIEEGNKIIGDFMGKNFKDPANLMYDIDWNELMPVVEKISKMEDGRFSVDISSVGMWTCYIKRDDVFEKEIADFGGFEPIILNVWQAVVKFLHWYNQNKAL